MDESGVKRALCRGEDPSAVPKLMSDVRITEERYFTFYDQVHTTGIDIKHTIDAVCLVTIGKGMTLRDLMQGAWRMRGIGKGQTIRYHMTTEIAELIRRELREEAIDAASEEERLANPEPLDIICWLIKNQLHVEELQRVVLGLQCFGNVWRRNALDYLLKLAREGLDVTADPPLNINTPYFRHPFLSQACFKKSILSLALKSIPQQPQCGEGPMCSRHLQNHGTTYRMIISSFTGGPYFGGWSCDRCGRSGSSFSTLERWFCLDCTSDICFNCVPRTGAPATASQVPQCGRCQSAIEATPKNEWGDGWSCDCPTHEGANRTQVQYGCATYRRCNWAMCSTCWKRESTAPQVLALLLELLALLLKQSTSAASGGAELEWDQSSDGVVKAVDETEASSLASPTVTSTSVSVRTGDSQDASEVIREHQNFFECARLLSELLGLDLKTIATWMATKSDQLKEWDRKDSIKIDDAVHATFGGFQLFDAVGPIRVASDHLKAVAKRHPDALVKGNPTSFTDFTVPEKNAMDQFMRSCKLLQKQRNLTEEDALKKYNTILSELEKSYCKGGDEQLAIFKNGLIKPLIQSGQIFQRLSGDAIEDEGPQSVEQEPAQAQYQFLTDEEGRRNLEATKLFTEEVEYPAGDGVAEKPWQRLKPDDSTRLFLVEDKVCFYDNARSRDGDKHEWTAVEEMKFYLRSLDEIRHNQSGSGGGLDAEQEQEQEQEQEKEQGVVENGDKPIDFVRDLYQKHTSWSLDELAHLSRGESTAQFYDLKRFSYRKPTLDTSIADPSLPKNVLVSSNFAKPDFHIMDSVAEGAMAIVRPVRCALLLQAVGQPVVILVTLHEGQSLRWQMLNSVARDVPDEISCIHDMKLVSSRGYLLTRPQRVDGQASLSRALSIVRGVDKPPLSASVDGENEDNETSAFGLIHFLRVINGDIFLSPAESYYMLKCLKSLEGFSDWVDQLIQSKPRLDMAGVGSLDRIARYIIGVDADSVEKKKDRYESILRTAEFIQKLREQLIEYCNTSDFTAQYDTVREMFASFSAGSASPVFKKEFWEKMMSKIGTKLENSGVVMDAVLNVIDMDGNESISITEFIFAVLEPTAEDEFARRSEEIRRLLGKSCVFSRLDDQGVGLIQQRPDEAASILALRETVATAPINNPGSRKGKLKPLGKVITAAKSLALRNSTGTFAGGIYRGVKADGFDGSSALTVGGMNDSEAALEYEISLPTFHIVSSLGDLGYPTAANDEGLVLHTGLVRCPKASLAKTAVVPNGVILRPLKSVDKFFYEITIAKSKGSLKVGWADGRWSYLQKQLLLPGERTAVGAICSVSGQPSVGGLRGALPRKTHGANFAFSTGDTVGCLLDLTRNVCCFFYNGIAIEGFRSFDWKHYVSPLVLFETGVEFDLNLGQRAFKFAPSFPGLRPAFGYVADILRSVAKHSMAGLNTDARFPICYSNDVLTEVFDQEIMLKAKEIGTPGDVFFQGSALLSGKWFLEIEVEGSNSGGSEGSGIGCVGPNYSPVLDRHVNWSDRPDGWKLNPLSNRVINGGTSAYVFCSGNSGR